MILNKITVKSVTSLIFLLFFSNIYSQNYNWITPNQTYLKMYVADDGIYRIEKTDFTNAGISTTGIDPRTVKVYYKGSQIPIYFSGEQDGIFDDADYFDFWGQRNYGGLTNAYNLDNSIAYTTNEYYNLYSDTSSYWISWNGSFGLRFINYNNSSIISYPNDYYYKNIRFEQDSIYFKGITINPDSDFRYFSNDKFQGEGWYMKYMQLNNSVTRNFTASLLSNTSQPVKVKLFAQPETQNTSVTNEHRLLFKINTYQSDSLKRDNFDRYDTTLTFPSSNLINGLNTTSFRYLYSPTTTAMTLYFDFYEISYPRRFEFENNTLSFNSDITDSTGKLFKIKGFNSANQINIYDTKNGCKIINYSFSNDTLLFYANGNGNFEIINKSITKKPFRIKQKQVPNLVTSSTGADYLIVYNKFFESQSEQLRQYRNTHNNFRSVKAEIEDIYDIFNFGIEDPIAVRRFAKNVFETWQTPKLKFLCLFGRGSLDPKKNSGNSSIYYQNFVPVYGNPPSDGYFANFNLGTFTYYPQVSIGRLPAYNTTEAQNMVNNIINYENQSVNDWTKKFTFISQGNNFNEQQSWNSRSNYYLSTYITSPPTSAIGQKIYLNDSSGLITYGYSDSIKNTLNNGTLLVNFMGHGGNGYWDQCFDNPTILSNQNKLPLILSMTCFTGKNSESNARGYCEKFLMNPNKGAIGFISTTGWSFSYSGDIYNEYLLNSFNSDTLRYIGDFVKKASLRMVADSGSFYSRNTINCYNLIGDPAAKLIIPEYPEFSVTNSDYSTSKINPTIKEKFNLVFYPKNYGTRADSCKIKFSILKDNIGIKSKDTIIYNFGYVDSLKYNISLDSIGIYKFQLILDSENWWTKESNLNNELEFTIPVKNFGYISLIPTDNQNINNDTVFISGINPNFKINSNTKLVLQVDTSKEFSSNIKQEFFKINPTGTISKFAVRIPILDSNIVYYWRLNCLVNNSDSIGWSEIKRFRYNNNFIQSDSSIFINNKLKGQFGEGNISFLANNNQLELNKYVGKITASSWGENMYDGAYIQINNLYKSLMYRINSGGFHVARIDRYKGNLIEYKHIYFSTAQSSDSLISFINSIDSNQIFMILKHLPIYSSFNPSITLKNMIRQMGSVYIDTVQLVNNWSRWSFVCSKSPSNPLTSEAYINTDWSSATSTINPPFLYPSGTITQTFGPAQTWQNFNWQQEVFPNSSLYFNVYGVNRNNVDTLLMQNLTTFNNVDLSGINAYQYPYLKLITRLSIDSVLGVQSPIFKGISLNYVGPPEIALDNNSIFKSDSIVNSGDSVSIGGNYYNVGYTPLNAHVRNYYALDGAGNKVPLRSDTIYQQIKVDSSLFFKATFKVKGLPIYKKYNNQIAIVIDVQALNQNDIYYYNNSVVSTFYVKGSVVDFSADVFSDGVKLFGNDYVRSDPELLIKLTGEDISQLLSADTTLFRIMINNQFVSLSNYSSSKNSKNLTKSSDKGNLAINLTPHLNEGLNELRLISNKTGSSDTAKFILNVTNETNILNVNNYPNPMRNNTAFVFDLTSVQNISECRIKIFSSAGRVIKEINVPITNPGNYQVQWNGQDADGDYIANGVYLYKIILKGSEQKATEVKKLVVLK